MPEDPADPAPYDAPTPFAQARAAVAAGTPVAEAARALVAQLTDDERLWCLDGDLPAQAGVRFQVAEDGYHRAPAPAAVLPRVGLPGFLFADGPRGAVLGDATTFPVSMARGATFDPALEERVGAAMGAELRAAGATFTGAVCVNVLRHPAWGRAQETYGEDPVHVGEMGAALTRGLQRHVLACVKHFACNSMENARFTVDVEVDEVALHEVFLPHFRRIVDEGVAAVMSAYNSVNGEWCGQNEALLTGVLRDEWGFEGVVISDFVFGLRDAATSLRAGLDVEMPFRMVRRRDLPGALARGEVDRALVDRAAERVVGMLLRFDAVLSAPAPPRTLLGAAGHRALAREVAARSVVLLRDEEVDGVPVLPLPAGVPVAVIGRLAAVANTGDGGSSDVWDLDAQPLLEGLRELPNPLVHDDGSDLDRAARTAAAAHTAVVVVGYTHLDEGEFIGDIDPSLYALFPAEDEPEVVERMTAWLATLPPVERPARLAERPHGFSAGGDRASLDLLPADVALVRAVAAAAPRTVVVLQAGSAVLTSAWEREVAGLVQAWYGGCRAGQGLADVLSGAVNPSARLPFSVPHAAADLPPFDRDARHARYDRWHGWWHLRRTGRAAAHPFGSGLSYTRFALGPASVERDGDVLHVRTTLANTGGRDGADVVQVYADLPDPDAPSRLVGFTRVEVPAGEEREVVVAVPVARLARRDPQAHAWVPAGGAHVLRVARHAEDAGPAPVTVVL